MIAAPPKRQQLIFQAQCKNARPAPAPAARPVRRGAFSKEFDGVFFGANQHFSLLGKRDQLSKS